MNGGLSPEQLLLALPEMVVLGMACLVLVVDAFLGGRRGHITFYLVQVTLVLALYLTLQSSGQGVAHAFGGGFVHDPMSVVLKSTIAVLIAVVFFYSRSYLHERGLHQGEFYVLGLFAMLGMMVLVSAGNLLVLYLGLELFSLSTYAMVAFNRDSSVSTEAGMKYFVLGALASGMLLYGISMLYGITGALDIPTVAERVASVAFDDLVLLFALSFVVVGVAFKLGAVPFHMWIPDVYHGALTPVTVFIGTAPKVAGFALAMRLLVDTLGSMHAEWQGMLTVLAVLSLAAGNIIAIAQSNLKRMLAYSTISHIGFILMGVLAGTDAGFSAAMFYSIAYAVMTLGGFGMIILLSRAGFEADNLDDFKGLNARSPWFAFMMLIFMFSMAGVPPLVGFHAKLAVLRAVIEVDLVWLAVFAVVMSVIGAFYYLRVVKLMYFDEPREPGEPECSTPLRAVLSVNGLSLLLLGLSPGLLMSLCMAAFSP